MSPATSTRRVVDTLNLFVLGWILYASLLPFEFELAPSSIWQRLGEGVDQGFSHRLGKHVVVHGALGLLWTAARPARRILPAAALACGVIELLQVLIAGRHPRLGDWAINTGAAWLGGHAGRVLVRLGLAGEPLATCRRTWGRMLRVAGWAGLALAAAVGAALSARQAHRGLGFGDWDPRFPLSVGQDADGGRRWAGALSGLALYPRAWDDTTLRHLSARPWDETAAARRLAGDGLAYAFGHRTPAPLAETSLGTALPEELGLWRGCELVRGHVARHPARVVAAEGDGWVSRGPMAEWSERARRSGAVTVVLEGRWPDAATDGPATIAAVGEGPDRCNLALVQDGRDLVLEVRCIQAARLAGPRRWSGPMARWPIAGEGSVAASEPFRLALSVARGQATLFSAGELVGRSEPLPVQFAERRIGGSGPTWLRALLWFAPFGFAVCGLAGALGLGRRSAWVAVVAAAPLGPLAAAWAEAQLASTSAAVPLGIPVWLGTAIATAAALLHAANPTSAASSHTPR